MFCVVKCCKTIKIKITALYNFSKELWAILTLCNVVYDPQCTMLAQYKMCRYFFWRSVIKLWQIESYCSVKAQLRACNTNYQSACMFAHFSYATYFASSTSISAGNRCLNALDALSNHNIWELKKY